MQRRIPSLRHSSDDAGQAVVMLLLFLVALLGSAALVIDIGRAYYAKRALQASVDASATAGAMELPDPAAAELVALQYSASPGGKNERASIPNVQTTVTSKCLSIAPCNPVNALSVQATTELETVFAKVLGIDDFTIRAKATACSPCGSRPADIMLVLDRTLSMCWDHWGNTQPGCPDLANARAGMRAFVQSMDPALHQIGLAVFPPASSVSARCSTPSDSNYHSTSSPYVIVQLSSDYKVGNNLNESSRLVSTIDCQKGGGQTAYANAIERAQAELDARGRPDVIDVIVFFSDGAANYGPNYYPSSSPYRRQPCHQGVWSAETAKNRGTLVFSIGYDLDAQNGGANECRAQSFTGPLESPRISAYDALQQIASDPTMFYDRPTPGDLTQICMSIASDIGGTRLVE